MPSERAAELKTRWIWLVPVGILLPTALATAFSKPLVGLTISGLLLISLGDLYFDLLFRRIGAFILRGLSAGRLPPAEVSPTLDFLVSLVSALIGVASVVAVLFLGARLLFSTGAA